MRIVNAVPWLQGLTARFIAVGVRPEHVHSPEAGADGFRGVPSGGKSHALSNAVDHCNVRGKR
jgi:hypothetical protein